MYGTSVFYFILNSIVSSTFFFPFRLLILSMLFFHLLVTFFSPNQIFQQKQLFPNQAFVNSSGLLIFCREKSKILRDFQEQIRGKIG